MRNLILALCAAVALSFSACAAGTHLRPGVGVSNRADANGARMGLDLGEYDLNGSVAHPVTGQAPGSECPGGVCTVPQVPPFRVSIGGIDFTLIYVILGLGLAGVGYMVYRRIVADRKAAKADAPKAA